jgi:dTDP-4-dehydrorhamnose reductase
MRLVYISTDYVFDGKKKIPYTIADRPHPLSRYGESKLLGEELVQRHAQRYFLVRTSWVFGSGNMNFARKALAWSHDKQEIEVVCDQVSSPTYTVDLAKATLDLLETGSYGLYHITNQGSCSRFEWVKTILNATGWTGRLIPTTSDKFPTPAMRPHYSVLDNFGSEEILGYVLPSWSDATSRFLEEMK